MQYGRLFKGNLNTVIQKARHRVPSRTFAYSFNSKMFGSFFFKKKKEKTSILLGINSA
jgi:hypothetical protein